MNELITQPQWNQKELVVFKSKPPFDTRLPTKKGVETIQYNQAKDLLRYIEAFQYQKEMKLKQFILDEKHTIISKFKRKLNKEIVDIYKIREPILSYLKQKNFGTQYDIPLNERCIFGSETYSEKMPPNICIYNSPYSHSPRSTHKLMNRLRIKLYTLKKKDYPNLASGRKEIRLKEGEFISLNYHQYYERSGYLKKVISWEYHRFLEYIKLEDFIKLLEERFKTTSDNNTDFNKYIDEWSKKLLRESGYYDNKR